ncbi:MAG: ABC transporter permease [Acidimicrobiia bacterium]
MTEIVEHRRDAPQATAHRRGRPFGVWTPLSRRAFLALLGRDLVVLRKDLWLFLSRTVMQPVLLLFVFTYVFPKIGQGIGAAGAAGGTDALSAEAFSTLLVGGVVASAMIFQGIQAVALPMVQDFGFTREIEDRVLAPIPVEGVALQKVASGAIQALLAAAVVLPLAYVVPASEVRIVIDWPIALTFLPLAAVLSASLGLTVGTRVEPRQVSLIFSLLVIPMTFLGAVYYPWERLDALPVLKWGVLVNPLVYLSEGVRMGLTAGVPHMPAPAIYAACAAFTTVLLALGISGFRNRVLA